MPTRRLYYENPHLREFAATVESIRERDGAIWASIDSTAFYPGGGGQPFDTGTIDGKALLEVAETDGEIWHRLAGDVIPGGRVACAVNWGRRFDHMQQHTGQHILSRAFVEGAGAETRSFHLGESAVTIDVSHSGPDSGLLRQIEESANRIVWENREVVTHVVSLEEARRYPLRKAPNVEGPVRVVEVADYDWSACGGTHVRRSGEVGLIAILGTERYKGGTRVGFAAGGRALKRLRDSGELLRQVSREFTSGESDLLSAILHLKEEREQLDHRLRPLLRESLEREAGLLLQGVPSGPHGPIVARHFPERDSEETSLLAAMVAARGGIALFITGDDTPRAHFSAPPGTISMGALLGRLCRSHGGRGGGRPESAQGTVPTERVAAVLQEALEAVKSGGEEGAGS